MKDEKEIKNFAILGVVVAGILIISLMAYFINKANSNANVIENQADASSVNEDENWKTVSTQIGKTVEDAENELDDIDNQTGSSNSMSENTTADGNSSVGVAGTNANTDSNIDKNANSNGTNMDTNSNSNRNTTSGNTNTENNNLKETNSETGNEDNSTQTTEVKFEKPISGKIIREFANESLVYSETLKEWVIHNGIDIQADKTSVVVSAANGTVSAIKNDPRYGLTVIINHDNGYQTVYANLLTAEFVVEGEEVSQGQTIGTVGNSASFEICDDYHLHFELLRDNEYVDPTIFIDFE